MGRIQGSEEGTSTDYMLSPSTAKIATTLSLGVPFHPTRNESLPDDITLPPWEREGVERASSVHSACKSEH